MSTTSTSGSTPFSGNSRYASDFQAIIDRSVAIASLPISQLNNYKTALTDRSTALAALDTKFEALQQAVQSLTDAMGSASYQASVANTTVLSATIGQGVVQGVYSVKVLGLGSSTTTLSPVPDGVNIVKVADPGKTSLVTDTSFTLTAGGTTHTISPTSNTLNSLAAAINAETDADVRATVVNVGSPADPDYRLSVQSTKLDSIAIGLTAGGKTLLEEQSRGAKASYNVNGAQAGGVDQVAYSDSRTVSVAPGLSVTLLSTSTTPMDITVTQSSSAISGALSAFATAYNAAVGEVDKHRGDANGALSGQSVVYSLSQALAGITSYGSSGSVASLSDLGFSFDRYGKLYFSELSFMAATFTSLGDITNFLGSAQTGFIKAAGDSLNVIEKPVSGVLANEIGAVQREITANNSRIGTEQARVDDLKQRLYEQMAAADAAIANMEQQYNYISSMFESMQSVSKNY